MKMDWLNIICIKLPELMLLIYKILINYLLQSCCMICYWHLVNSPNNSNIIFKIYIKYIIVTKLILFKTVAMEPERDKMKLQ